MARSLDRRLKIAVGCDFTYEAASTTPAVFLVRPSPSGEQAVLEERWESIPELHFRDYVDIYGNALRRVTIPPGTTTIRYDASVTTASLPDPVGAGAAQLPIDELPDDVLHYTLPSRYCPSDLLADTAWKLFAQTPPAWERVQAIVDYVHDRIRFTPGASVSATTALEAFESETGVCRDYAHLAISFCRAMNVPARYAFGYLPDVDVPPADVPMDFCAWFEAYLGDRWWTFDPRNNQRRAGRVLIARGRDALDVAMVTSYGSAILTAIDVRAEERG
jgi:transglutaminase-like putative cysteine protease